jgi:hypothetical protein
MARMLLLHLYIREDEISQKLARGVQGGFLLESWMALLRSGQVYDARITALKHPERPHFSSILLSTTYDGAPTTYHQFFFERLAFFFVSIALVARDEPPFTLADLTQTQRQAFLACNVALKDSEEAKSQEAFAKAQAAFREALPAFSAALAEDDQRKKDGEIEKTKFELFSDFVNRNDLLYSVGSPPEPGATASHDLRLPPPVTGRSNFLNPAIPEGPFPLTLPGK